MVVMGHASSQSENCVIIAGIGLIGGSIAAAVRKRFPGSSVIGVGRSADRLQKAQNAGLLTDWATEYSPELFSKRSVVVICLPVDMIADAVCTVAGMSTDDVLITDAGSVKQVICDAVRKNEDAESRFVGAHPIAGGENGGFEFADADLFQDRVCVVTGPEDSPGNCLKVERTVRFWSSIGCDVRFMSPADHDRVLALTSHLPHVMAAATMTSVGAQNLPLTGSGFRDVTRIAAGDAGLWQAILAGNRNHVIAAIEAAQQQLADFKNALQTQDDDQLEKLLAAAQQCRAAID